MQISHLGMSFQFNGNPAAPAIAQQQMTSNSLHDLLKVVTMNVSRRHVVIGAGLALNIIRREE